MHFHPLYTDIQLPHRLNNPFEYHPHPLCLQATDEVVAYVESQPMLLADAERGKMLGVLVVRRDDGTTGYLAAYSGLLAGRNDWPFFVPPVFDAQQPDGHFKQTEARISAMNKSLSQGVSTLSESSETLSPQGGQLADMKQQRKLLSEELQLWLFRQYRMLNRHGEVKDLVEIWRDYHSSERIRSRFPLPPGGSGDCCAPKLLQYAYQHQMQPLQIAEFWYGQSPRGEVRHHRQFYPACRGKCRPILSFMLQGLDVEPEATVAMAQEQAEAQLQVIYEDEAVLVIEKPPGLLSVPGRIAAPSVASVLNSRYGQVFLPHRLDMDTSGLMVVALTDTAYKQLQQQFYARTIYKRYIALLSSKGEKTWAPGMHGNIELPLRPDPLDRPRQVVDHLHGKTSITEYEILSIQPSGRVLVSLIPHTGRTHQLRVHCAHAEGLGHPIVGDNLYGCADRRLFLQAIEIAFDHPLTGSRMQFSSQEDFGNQ